MTSGTAVYVETFTPTTNEFGLINLNIGAGTVVSGDLTTIDWSADTYFIKIEMDITGETTYEEYGISQLLSVPYALHAKSAESITGTVTETDPVYGSSVANGITGTDTTKWNNATQNLSISGNSLSISKGNTVTLPGGDGSVPVYTTTEIAALTPSEGDAVFNSTENLYQIYNGSAWQSFNSNCWPQPTIADSGSDQIFDNGTTTTALSANTPEAEHGTGEWSIVNGTGGSFTDPADPSTNFNGQLHETYTLRWTISTNCSTSEDEVIIGFWQDEAGTPITDVDGNSYNTVYIGGQLWMTENLKVTHYHDGTPIPLVEDESAWDALGYTDKAYCYYQNSSANGDTYGALYTWAAAMNDAASSDNNPSRVQGVCPDGWHLPSDDEWTELTDYLGGESGAGGKLKETGTTHWNSANTGATNSSGFTALPGGYRLSDGSFLGLGLNVIFWSATEYGSSRAWRCYLNHECSAVNRHNIYKTEGFSVRCTKD